MKWRLTSLACVFAAATALPVTTYAQNTELLNQINNLEREQTALTQQVSVKQKQIEVLRSRPSPEQSELAEARRAVDTARAAYKADNSATNEAMLKNAEFKATLAERKYDKANSDVAALRADAENLKQQIANKQRQLKSLQQQAAEQAAAPKAVAVPVVTQQRAEDSPKQKQQDLELERTRKQNDAAQKEIERLKALLATKEAAATSVVATPAKAAAVQQTTPAPTPAVTPAPVTNAATAVTGLQQLSTKAEVVSTLQAFATRAAGDNQRGRSTNEIVYFKPQSGTEKGMVRLKALGNQQYRGNADLSAGSYDVVLGTNRWKTTISGIAADTSFTVLLDMSNAAQPQIIFYNATLEK